MTGEARHAHERICVEYDYSDSYRVLTAFRLRNPVSGSLAAVCDSQAQVFVCSPVVVWVSGLSPEKSLSLHESCHLISPLT